MLPDPNFSDALWHLRSALLRRRESKPRPPTKSTPVPGRQLHRATSALGPVLFYPGCRVHLHAPLQPFRLCQIRILRHQGRDVQFRCKRICILLNSVSTNSPPICAERLVQLRARFDYYQSPPWPPSESMWFGREIHTTGSK